jgi:hypothetical protein
MHQKLSRGFWSIRPGGKKHLTHAGGRTSDVPGGNGEAAMSAGVATQNQSGERENLSADGVEAMGSSELEAGRLTVARQ